MLADRQVRFRSSFLVIVPFLLTLTFAFSAWKSSSPFLSFVGGATQEYTSVLTMAGLSLLFFLCLQVFSDKQSRHFVHVLFLFSACLVGIRALIGLWTGAEMPNTIGTINAVGVYLIVMTMFGLVLWVSYKKTDTRVSKGIRSILEQAFIISLSLVTGVYLLILDYGLLWFLFEAGLLLLFAFVCLRSKDFSSLGRFLLPMVFFIGIIPFWFWLPSPLSISVPTEVTLSQQASQDIAYRTLDRISPIFGSGPGTYVFDYTQSHDQNINQSEFFKTRFDRASSFMFTLVPTVGILGVSFFVMFFLFLGMRSILYVLGQSHQEARRQMYVLFVPWLVLLISACVYPFNITLMTMLFLLSGLMASRIPEVSPLLDDDKQPVVRLGSLVGILLGSICFLTGVFFVSQRYGSEVAFAKAVRSDRQDASLTEVIQWLDTAVTFNQFDDRALRTLAQALLLRVQEQLQLVSSSDDLTEEAKAYIQGLMAASINAGVRATELSPENVVNWLMRGAVYRELMGVVPNADVFAIQAFETTTQLDPVNPVSWTELGTTYMQAAEQKRPLTTTTDAEQAHQAQILVEEYLNKGETSLNKAIELKSTYAPAHYQLGLAYERQGRLDDAIGKMESVALYNPEDVGVAFQLGQLYLRRAGTGDVERAKHAFEYAIVLTPTYSNARWFLASIYEQEGNLDGAIEQIKKVLELNPENALVQSRLERLKNGQITTAPLVPLP